MKERKSVQVLLVFLQEIQIELKHSHHLSLFTSAIEKQLYFYLQLELLEKTESHGKIQI